VEAAAEQVGNGIPRDIVRSRPQSTGNDDEIRKLARRPHYILYARSGIPNCVSTRNHDPFFCQRTAQPSRVAIDGLTKQEFIPNTNDRGACDFTGHVTRSHQNATNLGES
jgi:hypothetical protein